MTRVVGRVPSERRIRGYVVDAVGAIRRNAVFSAEVDWDAVAREAGVVAEAARSYADTHSFLTAVLKEAGGRHSHLTVAGRGQSPGSQTPPTRQIPPNPQIPQIPPIPTGHLVEGVTVPLAHLRLPRLPDSRKAVTRYLADGTAAMRSLLEARPHGWIMDLRANGGGNMWPMLAVAAPLLPEGVLGRFVRADGRSQDWYLRDSAIGLGTKTMARSRITRPPNDRTPIAVLTSSHTASAGEAAALAFRAQPRARLIGRPTAGLTTGNQTVVLRDGTRLHISAAFYADPDGELLDGPVPIDQYLEDNSREAATAAAVAWLLG